MSDEIIDVLAVIELQAYRFRAARLTRPIRECADRELRAARAAIAELIEADKEYDLAAAAVLACTNKPAHILVTIIDYADAARGRFEAAKARRAAALARAGATK